MEQEGSWLRVWIQILGKYGVKFFLIYEYRHDWLNDTWYLNPLVYDTKEDFLMSVEKKNYWWACMIFNYDYIFNW